MALIASLAAIPVTVLAVLKLRGGDPGETWDPERYLSSGEDSDAETEIGEDSESE